MTDPQPQYAPGDRVLVAGTFRRAFPDGETDVRLAHWDGEVFDACVRASDVHPVPPTPDPRDTAIDAVIKLHPRSDEGQCRVCVDEGDNPQEWPCETLNALAGVATLPIAPPATLPPLTAEDMASCEPSITTLPIVSGEDGDFLGWGHIEPQAFADAANALEAHYGCAGDEPWTSDNVRHLWAVTLMHPNDGGEWWVHFVPEGTAGYFAVTALP